MKLSQHLLTLILGIAIGLYLNAQTAALQLPKIKIAGIGLSNETLAVLTIGLLVPVWKSRKNKKRGRKA